MNPEVDEGVSLTRNDINFHSACHDGDGLKKKGRDQKKCILLTRFKPTVSYWTAFNKSCT
jgi:hypothetical protein